MASLEAIKTLESSYIAQKKNLYVVGMLLFLLIFSCSALLSLGPAQQHFQTFILGPVHVKKGTGSAFLSGKFQNYNEGHVDMACGNSSLW